MIHSVAVNGFASGLRITLPVAVSGAVATYFLPNPLAGVVVGINETTPAVAITTTLAAPRLLDAARFSCEDVSTFAADGTAARALTALSQSPLTADCIRTAHAALMHRRQPSPWRDGIAWVNGHSPEHAKLVPPPSSAIDALIADLCAFLARPDVPLWIKQALAYYQFVHIHPFADGNGRMSRLLVAALGTATSSDRTRSMIIALALSVHRKAFIRHFDEMHAGSTEAYLAIWQRLDSWAGNCAVETAESERPLMLTLKELVGDHAHRLFDRFANHGGHTMRETASVLRWSTKNASRHLDRLRAAGWIEGTDEHFVAVPIRNAQRDLVLRIARDSASILV